MKKSNLRKGTKEDLYGFYAAREPNRLLFLPTVHVWVGEVDGRVVGLGGLAFRDGHWIAFCDLTPEARRYKISIVRLSRQIMSWADAKGIRRIYAQIDPAEAGAVHWALSLGFKPWPDLPTSVYCRET